MYRSSKFTLMLAAVLISSCASVVVSHRFDATPSVTKSQYDKSSGEMGTVVLAMNSNRYWGCGGYENAELQSMGFDLLPARHTNNDQAPEFVINGSSGGPDFMVYSSMLAPGTYALSYIKIKVARSMSEVAYLTAERSSLIENHLPVAGTFNVQAGEVVYIGHFGLDCVNQPMLWRFYKEDKQSFKEFQDALNVYIPYLDDATFRLFETSHFGYDFSL